MDVTVVMDIFSARTAVSDLENGHNESLVLMPDLINTMCLSHLSKPARISCFEPSLSHFSRSRCQHMPFLG